MPPGLVEAEPDFDKNPRLASVVGFFLSESTMAGHNLKAT
jgi:hypothetical protein